MAKGSGEIVIAGRRHNIGWPVTNFMDDGSWNGHSESCINPSHTCEGGKIPFAQYRSPAQRAAGAAAVPRTKRYRLRKAWSPTYLKQFVIHLDGCRNARDCFNVLHNERGLSCHFLIDNDGHIYQTIDIAHCAFHAANLNETSIGVELANRGDAKKYPNFYRSNEIKRDLVSCTIHGHKYLAYGFTEQQYQAMGKLGIALAKLLPNIKLEFPRSGDGKPASSLIKDFTAFQGYVGHYHIEMQKWDPGPWDWQKFMRLVSGRRSFPVGLNERAGKIEMPTDEAELAQAAELYYANNEQTGDGGGYFPVGPWKPHRLWHSGIHLHADENARVHAPLKGFVVAARMAPYSDTIGSTNFVLIRHDEAVGNEKLSFYSLYFHLAPEAPDDKNAPKWIASEGYGDPEPGTTVVLDPPQPVQAGDVIGRVGLAGPEGLREAQLHFEIFMDKRVPKALDPDGAWKFVDGSSDGIFCRNEDIIKSIDRRKKDGVFTTEELNDYYRGGDGAEMRSVVAYHVSEWSEKANWETELAGSGAAGDLKEMGLKPAQVKELVEAQILPTLWWTDSVAESLKIPRDARVFTYHPIGFLVWLQKHLAAAKADEFVKAATADDIRTAKAGTALDDRESNGDDMINEDDLAAKDDGPELELEDMIKGYGDEKY